MSWRYSILALAIFAIEVCIALFVKDMFVRPYVGDMLAVVLVYAILRAIGLRAVLSLVLALAAAFAIEAAQAFFVLRLVGFADNQILRTIFGGSFDVYDLLAYSSGALLAGLVELALHHRRRARRKG